MQFKFFHIPTLFPNNAADELNRFLATHQIHDVQSDFVSEGKTSFWAIQVTYLLDTPSKPSTGKPAVDYRRFS